MALPLGKVTLIIGAGILGSVLAKEGSDSKFSDYIFIPVKLVWNQLKRDDSPPANGKPRTDALLAQVKIIQQQLRDLGNADRPLTIYSGGRSGGKNIGFPVLGAAVVGVGYMWWKGYKFSDLMFATKRSLEDARSSVGKQLDHVTSSVAAARNFLSKRIDRVDVNVEECKEITAATRDEVSELRGDVKVFSVDVESVHRAVKTLESKIGRIEEKQDFTANGVRALCDFVQTVENSTPAPSLPASSPFSRATIEEPPLITPALRSNSLPPKPLALESASPSSSTAETPKMRRFQTTGSASGLKDFSNTTMSADKSEVPITSSSAKEEQTSNGSSSSSRFGWKLPSLNASFLSRTSSAI
ncbi:hypothetical protein ACHQM5_010478 [Ranunculus cassubicifolius]